MDPCIEKNINSASAATEISIYDSNDQEDMYENAAIFSSMTFNSDPFISNSEYLCTDSMREYEEYVEAEAKKSELDSCLISSAYNVDSVRDEESNFILENSKDAFSLMNDDSISDSMVKRCKSSNSFSILNEVDNKEANEYQHAIDNKEANEYQHAIDNKETNAYSGFKTGLKKDIYVSYSKIEMAKAELGPKEKDPQSIKFIKSLMSSQDTINDDELVIFGNEEMGEFNTSLIEDRHNNTQPIEYDKNEEMVISGFTTGKNKTILINPKSIKAAEILKNDAEIDLNINKCDNAINKSNNIKEDIINKPAILNTTNETAGLDNTTTNKSAILNTTTNKTDNKSNTIIKTDNKSNTIIKTDNKINTKEFITKCNIATNEDILMKESFVYATNHFKKQQKEWIFEQFKWSWLHLFLNKEITTKQTVLELSEKIIEIMELKLKYEKSILRRIVEFDDVPFRFMILGIIDYAEDYAELFDGFYALKFKINRSIYAYLKSREGIIGSKLYVFGAKLLIKEPTSIFDIEGMPLELCYNGVRICSNGCKLGMANKISFLNTISNIRPDGGTVSAIIGRIKRIVEYKYYVSVENYKSRVDDLEKEIEKIYEIAEKTGYKISIEDITVRQYSKIVIEDGTGECILTWWSPPEIRVGEKYKFVNLNVIEGFEKHFVTSNKTYSERVIN